MQSAFGGLSANHIAEESITGLKEQVDRNDLN
jgi:hypothetical protein